MLKADHVVGGVFIAFGILIFAISGELPFGTLSAPSAGMMPKLDATLMMVFAALILLRAKESPPAASVDWSDRGHAALVLLITGLAVAAYQWAGFLITMAALVFALLVVVERRNAPREVLRAAAYSIGLTLFAYWLFGHALKSPLERGLLGF
jgi:putative tricarboxylic transport membrane protein